MDHLKNEKAEHEWKIYIDTVNELPCEAKPKLSLRDFWNLLKTTTPKLYDLAAYCLAMPTNSVEVCLDKTNNTATQQATLTNYY